MNYELSTKAYIDFFENLSAHTALSDYHTIFHEKIFFKDPFHTINHIQDLYALFQNMFHSLQYASFEVKDYALNNKTLYIRWVFSYAYKNKAQPLHFEGMSYVEFNDEGKACKHIDYWDAASNIYENIPLVGWLIGFIKNKIKTAQ